MPTPHHLLCPTTDRTARELSRAYGFSSPEALAESLPTDAVVADIGTGLSTLGDAIAEARSDINWLNVDIRYSGHAYLSERQLGKKRQASPDNVHYVAGNALSLGLKQGAFDRVYSSWMLPHLYLTSPKLATAAVHNMAQLLRADGSMSVHSRKTRNNVSARDYHADPDKVAQDIVQASRLGIFEGAVQRYVHISAAMSWTGEAEPRHALRGRREKVQTV